MNCSPFRNTWIHPRCVMGFVLLVWFVDRRLSFCALSFGQCVVCSSSIYGFFKLFLQRVSPNFIFSWLRFRFPVPVEALMVHNKSVRSTQMTSGLKTKAFSCRIVFYIFFIVIINHLIILLGLMLQNNLRYSFNGFSDNSQVYANIGNVGNVSDHKNRDIQSK